MTTIASTWTPQDWKTIRAKMPRTYAKHMKLMKAPQCASPDRARPKVQNYQFDAHHREWRRRAALARAARKQVDACQHSRECVKPKVFLADLLRTASEVSSEPEFQINSDRQDKHLVRIRQAVMWLAFKYSGLSKAEIGRRLNRDHSTVCHACRSVDRHPDRYRPLVSAIEKRLGI